MRFYDFWKEHRAFILSALAAVLFFLVFQADNYIRIHRITQDYETQIEELKSLVLVTNIGKEPEIEFDIYQTAEEFLTCYYGVSKDMSGEYRKERLENLMTSVAYAEYAATEYDNTLNYTVTLTDIHIYVDYKNSSKEGVYACVFYNENTDWPEINTITVKKYWTGTFVFDNTSEKWRVDGITDCQELLTREEFDALAIDTDKSAFESTEGGDGNADTGSEE